VRKRIHGAFARLIQFEFMRMNKWTESVRFARLFSRKILVTIKLKKSPLREIFEPYIST